jgi:hypothetical protein
MRSLSKILAVPAFAVCALVASALMPHGGRAEAACHPETFHDEQAEGGVCCFPEHYHTGTSTSQNTRAEAVNVAIESWEDFVWIEYGADYAHYSLAHSKSMDCSSSGGWACTIHARPCHRD